MRETVDVFDPGKLKLKGAEQALKGRALVGFTV
jgi:hypothetical protein